MKIVRYNLIQHTNSVTLLRCTLSHSMNSSKRNVAMQIKVAPRVKDPLTLLINLKFALFTIVSK